MSAVQAFILANRDRSNYTCRSIGLLSKSAYLRAQRSTVRWVLKSEGVPKNEGCLKTGVYGTLVQSDISNMTTVL